MMRCILAEENPECLKILTALKGLDFRETGDTNSKVSVEARLKSLETSVRRLQTFIKQLAIQPAYRFDNRNSFCSRSVRLDFFSLFALGRFEDPLTTFRSDSIG
jgi:hypothetical protein